MLARLLQLANVPCTVFEADASPNYRSQGSTLDLLTDTGLAALKDVGSLTSSRSSRGTTASPCSSPTRTSMCSSSWTRPLPAAAAGGAGPRSTAASSGACSPKACPLTRSAGATAWSGSARLRTASKAGGGCSWCSSTFACVEGRRVSVQQMGGLGELHVAVTFRFADEAWISEERRLARPLAQVKELLLGPGDTGGGTFGDYHPLLRDAVDKAQGGCTSRALYAPPGVNVGLEDARRLATAVVAALARPSEAASGQGLLERLGRAVQEFEEEMWPRARRHAELTDELMKLYFFTPGSPRTAIAKIVSLHTCFDAP
ncbi:hypothetical protein RB596_006018 [Gaeumannomyces avenae]